MSKRLPSELQFQLLEYYVLNGQQFLIVSIRPKRILKEVFKRALRDKKNKIQLRPPTRRECISKLILDKREVKRVKYIPVSPRRELEPFGETKRRYTDTINGIFNVYARHACVGRPQSIIECNGVYSTNTGSECGGV